MPIYTISDIRCASVSNKKQAGKLTCEKNKRSNLIKCYQQQKYIKRTHNEMNFFKAIIKEKKT